MAQGDIICAVTAQTTSTLWLEDLDVAVGDAIHRVIAAVVDQGGAVGWLRSPTREETLGWLRGWHDEASTGRAGLVLGLLGDRIQALGGWRAGPEGPTGHVVELTKIMVHPDARGSGLGRLVVQALGFKVWGVLPNGVAVDRYRFDDVRTYRQLALPSDAVVHRSAHGGIGDSARRT